MANAAIYAVSVSLQLQQIDLATALVEINRVYSPQVNCASLSPVEINVTNGTPLNINPIGNCNFLFVTNRDKTNTLAIQYGSNGAAAGAGEGVTLGPGGVFIFFDVSGMNYINAIVISVGLVGGTVPMSIITASING